ncbi:MAG: HAMP domain-containing histidine kinase [Coriobacteriales bacterium]|jgi:signal transduction histidine kinase|nr:HAMP domain-containing histidine kinase [Coriobacteriales bacterium]
MIKKLRNRFLLMTIAIMALVMLVSFTTIYLISYVNTSRGFTQLYIQFRNATSTVDSRRWDEYMREIEGLQEDEYYEQSSQSNLSLLFEDDGTRYYTYKQTTSSSSDNRTVLGAVLNEDGKITDLIYTPNLTYEKQHELVSACFESNHSNTPNRISFADREWLYWYSETRFSWSPGPNGSTYEVSPYYSQRIIVIDITPELTSLNSLAMVLGITGLAMLAVLGLASFVIANMSLKPVQAAWDRQQLFISDASHELKTPITILNTNLEVIQNNADQTVSSQEKWLENIQVELTRMDKLVNDLLVLAHTEGNQSLPRRFDLSSLVTEVGLAWEAAIYERGISYSEEITSAVKVIADPEQIRQVLTCLMDNAHLYTEPKGWIKVTLSTTADHAVVAIENSGPGIAADDLPKIFDRFYRPDPSRSTESGGYGLGLAIAKSIIEQSGGNIGASSSDGLTRFAFSLRLA